MKKNLSFTLKTIAFAVFFLFSSCSEDVYNSTQNQNSKYISIQSKKFSDLKFDNRFAEPFALVKAQLENYSALNRSMFGVEVDTTIVNEILHEDFTTYSLLIKNESESTTYYENLAIKIDEQNQTSAAILKYNIDDQKNIVSTEINPIYGEFLNSEDDNSLNIETSRCQLIQIIVEHPCTVGNTHTNGEPFGCSMEGNNAYVESFWLTVCSGGGEGFLYPQPAGPIDGPSGNFQPTGGGFAPVPLTNAQLFFNSLNIVEESNFQILNSQAQLTLVNYLNNNPYNTFINFNIKKFFNNLSFVNSDWFQNQSDQTQTNIINYLCQNNFDSNSNQFVNELMDYELNNNLYVSPNSPIEDFLEYIECLDLTQGATITIYADQPVNNSNTPYSLSPFNVGHAFIGIKQGDEQLSFGFYPENGTGFFNPTNGILGNDQNHSFDVSITINVNSTTLVNILGLGNDYSTGIGNFQYDLDTNNCTDFIINISNECGLGIPDCFGNWPLGGGSNPGAFGQYIRTMSLPSGATRNTSGGSSPTNHKGC